MCQFTTFSQSANFYFFQYLTFSRNNRDYMTTTTALKKIPFIRTNSYQTKELSTFYDGPLIKPIKTTLPYPYRFIQFRRYIARCRFVQCQRYLYRCRFVQCLRNLDRWLSFRTNVDVTFTAVVSFNVDVT